MKTLRELERIAKAATEGPWQKYEDGRRSNLLPNYAIESCTRQDIGGDPAQICEQLKGKNAAHIAAFDPPTVLALIADYKAMKEAIEYYALISPKIEDLRIVSGQPARDCLASLKLEKV